MKPGAPWSIKGIEAEAREAAKEKAREAGMTLGQWLNQTIADAGKPPAAQAASPAAEPGGNALDTARVMRAIAEVARRVDVAAAAPGAGGGNTRADFERIEARLDDLAAAIPAAAPQLDQSRLERGLVAIARRIDQVEKSIQPSESVKEELQALVLQQKDTTAFDQSIAAFGGQLEQLTARLDGIDQKLQEPETQADETPDQIGQDVRKLMNGMVNLAAKIDKLENRVDSGLQPLQTGIEDLPSKVAAQGAEERLGLEKRLGEASASSGNVNPAMIQAAIAAAMGPVSTAVADLRDRLDQNEAGGSSHQAPAPAEDTAAGVAPDEADQAAADEASESGMEPAPAAITAATNEGTATDPADSGQAISSSGAEEADSLSGLASLHDLTRADDIQVRPFDDDDGFFHDIAPDEQPSPSESDVTTEEMAPGGFEAVAPTEEHLDEPEQPDDEEPVAPQPVPTLDHVPDEANPPDRPRRLVPVESLLAGPGSPGRGGNVPASGGPGAAPDVAQEPREEPAAVSAGAAPGERKPFRLDEPLDLSRQAPAPPPANYPGRRRWVGYLLVALFFLALFIGGFWFSGTPQFRVAIDEAGKLWEQAVTAVKGADFDTDDDGADGTTGTSAEATQAAATPLPASAPATPADTATTAAAPETPAAKDADQQVAALQPRSDPVTPAPAPAPAAEKSELEKLQDRAEAGESDAQYTLGVRHRDGIGLEPDYSRAADWFDRAAQQGHVPAQLGLGIMYRQGLGRPRDLDLAKLWLHAASRAGDPDAQKLLGEVYVDDTAGVPDYFQAARWFREAAEQGVVDAQYNMGVLYEGGLGVPRDFGQAYYWFSLAEKAGDKSAPEDRERNAQLLTPEQRAKLDQQVAGFSAVSAPAPAATSGTAANADDVILQRRDEIRTLQQLLIARGYDPGTPDGIPGAKTRQAIQLWQADQGMTQTGQINRKVLESLRAGG
jgi:localization factor PodJL